MKAYVFPGQGAQFVGMGKDLYDNSPIAHELFEKANEILKNQQAILNDSTNNSHNFSSFWDTVFTADCCVASSLLRICKSAAGFRALIRLFIQGTTTDECKTGTILYNFIKNILYFFSKGCLAKMQGRCQK